MNITNVNLSGLIYLEEVTIRGNNISTIDLNSQPNLKILNIEASQITGLDLSSKTHLEELTLTNNQLTSLNVKNNNNTIIYAFDATGNPNLGCIQVDNQVNAIAATGSYSSWLKDATASYAENCNPLSTDTFNSDIANIYPNPIKNNQILQFKNIDSDFSFSLFDISGKLIEKKVITNNQFEISRLPKGVYSYILQSDNKIITNKLVIID
ncbi:MAG: T9SS type A sorting domain-containing protein [Flavobacterium sp.]|nr:T9SS type A sorting domain-containing protein [Flavobacterium sp.]